MADVLYNEIDQRAAGWLRNLIEAGELAGHVDDRDIRDLQAADLAGYRRVHLFAGIGGWEIACRLARWPERLTILTGSCPCQPFSRASAAPRGTDDDRHLWPEMGRLVGGHRPVVVCGEQVADDPSWIDLVFDDLEAMGYTCWATVLPACSVAAPHRRERLYWMGHANGAVRRDSGGRAETEGGGRLRSDRDATCTPSNDAATAIASGYRRGFSLRSRPYSHGPAEDIRRRTDGPWRKVRWLRLADGSARPTESSTYPLADGFPGDMAAVRAAGNAIVVPLAAEFLRASLALIEEER